MKTTLANRLNAAVWVVAAILSIQPLLSGRPATQFITTVVATLFWMAVYYFFFHVIAPKYLLEKKLLQFFAISVAILIMLPCIGYTLLFLTRALAEGTFDKFYSGYTLATHLSGFKAMALAGVYGSFFRMITVYLG